MEMDALRVAVAMVMLAPMAYYDLRERMMYLDVTLVCVGIAAAFLAYDVATGGIGPWQGMAFWSNCGMYGVVGAMVALHLRGMCGAGDPSAFAVVAFMLPVVGGTAVPIWALLAGMVSGVAAAMLTAAASNVSDMAAGRRFSPNLVLTHYKRRGQRFRMAAGDPAGLAPLAGDEPVKRDGSRAFLPAESEGMEVVYAMPLAFFLALGLAGALAVAVLFPGLLPW